MSCLLYFSAYSNAGNINPYPYPVIECKACSIEEIEVVVSTLAKLDEVLTVALVDPYKGKAYAYSVENI